MVQGSPSFRVHHTGGDRIRGEKAGGEIAVRHLGSRHHDCQSESELLHIISDALRKPVIVRSSCLNAAEANMAPASLMTYVSDAARHG